MDVQAVNMTVEQMFNKGKFIIPDYQRPFDWGEDEISEFIDDILSNINKDYFIGHFVFDGQMSDSEFFVVDGQQRITTLTILLCAIRDIYSKIHGDSDLTNGINDNYIFKKDRRNQNYPILKTDMPYPLFQEYVQEFPKPDNFSEPKNSGEKNIIYAYDYLFDRLKKLKKEKLEELVDAILKLELIFVASKGRINAHSIFMTLNAKGKDLTFVDLIKNDIFHRYESPKSKPKELEEKWKIICSNFGDKGEDFFLTFWKSRYKVNISNEKFYKEYTELVSKQGFNIKSFVNDLLDDSEIYSQIQNPVEGDWINQSNLHMRKVYYHLHNIKIVFNIEVVDSFLLSLIRAFRKKNISSEFLIKTLRSLDNFHFINNAICINRLAGFEKLYPSHAIRLFNSKNRQDAHTELTKFREKIIKKILPLDTFRKYFDSRVYFFKDTSKFDDRKAKNLAYYCLYKIEMKEQNWNVFFDNLSLEHLHPTSIMNNTFKKSSIQSLGNLVLLDRDINSLIGNKPFLEKKKVILERNKLITTKNVVENCETWDTNSIKSRGDILVDSLYELSINELKR